ncbi:hypothetical protein ZHAS_00018634 [Anopheles sinensis]|uniref:Uncharacterized protein n=1 Tax=Anopheles sinensis TaxID=74873 RepID=A0A084WJG8_ANOSI|nr:hypothetical protein ZHAS_00018634 [Anopheles sinensis]
MCKNKNGAQRQPNNGCPRPGRNQSLDPPKKVDKIESCFQRIPHRLQQQQPVALAADHLVSILYHVDRLLHTKRFLSGANDRIASNYISMRGCTFVPTDVSPKPCDFATTSKQAHPNTVRSSTRSISKAAEKSREVSGWWSTPNALDFVGQFDPLDAIETVGGAP